MRIIILASIITIGTLIGCHGAAKDEAALNAARCDRWVSLMETGQVTSAQNIEFIKANRIAWWAQNYNLNGAELPADVQSAIDARTVLEK